MMNSNILLETGTNELEIIEFMITFTTENNKTMTQSYGINVAKIREIIKLPELTYIPAMPDSVKGVFNLRNQVITAVDVNRYLYNQSNDSDNSIMIVAEFNGRRIGFIVNEVSRIWRFSWQKVEAPEVINQFAGNKSTIVGIVKVDQKNILLLDVEKIIFDIQPEMGMKSLSPDQHNIISNKTALIAEDSPTIRTMIVKQLSDAGFTVQAFNDGLAIWDYLQFVATQNETTPDIVITDIEMPRLDGYSLTQNIKTHPQLSHIPVVLFSSLINDDVLHKGKKVGADLQLTKPQLSELVTKVYHLLEPKELCVPA